MGKEEVKKHDKHRAPRPKKQAKVEAEAEDETESEIESEPEEQVESHEEFEIQPIFNPRAGANNKWSYEAVITLLAYIEWCVETGKDFRTEAIPLLNQELGTSTKRINKKAFDMWVKHKKRKHSNKICSYLLAVGIESLNLDPQVIQSVRDRVREIRPTTGSSVPSTEATPTRRRLVIVSESHQGCSNLNH